MTARRRLLRKLFVLSFVAALLGAGAAASSASAAGGWWLVNQSFAPGTLANGQEGAIVVSAVDGGYQAIEAVKTKKTTSNIVLTDTLPAGVEVLGTSEAVQGQAGPQEPKAAHPLVKLACTITGVPATGQTVTCPVEGLKLLPFEELRLKVLVNVLAENGARLTNQVKISGGAVEGGAPAPSATAEKSTTVSSEPATFGAEPEGYKLRPENQDGSLDTQAGSHPFQLSTTFNLNKDLFAAVPVGGGKPLKFYGSPALTKNLHFDLPPGLLGRVAGFPKCSSAEFNEVVPGPGGLNACPTNTAIGVASASIYTPVVLGDYTASVPIFNITPNAGEPARFGFTIDEVPVVLTTKVRTGSDYGVEVSVHYAPETADVLSSQVVFWGVPGDARHDNSRGWACLDGKYWVEGETVEEQCENEDKPAPPALLTMPTVCGANPVSTVSGESWPKSNEKGEEETVYPLAASYTFESPFAGCEKLPFEPSISVAPNQTSTSTPTGLDVKITVPQASTVSGEGLAEADIRNQTLQLPAGMLTAGGAASGLQACSAEQLGFTGFGESLAEQLENDHFTPNADSCPDAAKVGTVRIKTPLVEEELFGSVYLARVDTAPFKSPLVLYITAEEATSKVKVKLAGEVSINEATGQLTSKFIGAPPLPFEELDLHLFDGGRSTQSTPERCGTYSAGASFLASSSTEGHPVEVNAEPSFAITSGPGGSACPAAGPLPFGTPAMAGVTNSKGGAFSPFVVTLERPDGNQALKSVTVHEPPGAAAMLASVTPCPTAIAEQAEPSCPASSEVGVSTAFAGLGGEPTQLPGTVYLTGPYHGAPFGLLAVTDATHVGPFDLGRIPVLSTINVNPTTAAATVTSNPLPQFAPKPGQPGTSTGIPSQIKKLVIDVDRPGFTFNPTNCEVKSVGIETTGYEGGTSSKSVPFQASGCGALPFKPTISVNVESDYSRVDGTGMKIKLTARPGDANIKLTHLVFPGNVPSRLTTIQKACKVQIFEVNPANCPEGSVIGTAVAHTPVLKSPLTGPAYLVSHANESFPDSVFILQGEGIKLVLDGKTNIKTVGKEESITSSTFSTVPDAPVTSFEVDLPRGPHSAFSGYGNLCEKAIKVPTEFGGQNGALIQSETKVTVEKCGAVLPAKKESELAKLLKKCKKLTKHKKRVACEATARKQVKAVATCKKKNKGHTKKINSCVAAARKKYALKLK